MNNPLIQNLLYWPLKVVHLKDIWGGGLFFGLKDQNTITTPPPPLSFFFPPGSQDGGQASGETVWNQGRES